MKPYSEWQGHRMLGHANFSPSVKQILSVSYLHCQVWSCGNNISQCHVTWVVTFWSLYILILYAWANIWWRLHSPVPLSPALQVPPVQELLTPGSSHSPWLSPANILSYHIFIRAVIAWTVSKSLQENNIRFWSNEFYQAGNDVTLVPSTNLLWTIIMHPPNYLMVFKMSAFNEVCKEGNWQDCLVILSKRSYNQMIPQIKDNIVHP